MWCCEAEGGRSSDECATGDRSLVAFGWLPPPGRSRVILEGIDLSVSSGEVVCLLGPNGTGKSTLLQTLAGLQKALAGEVRVAGNAIDGIRAIDLARLIGVVLSERISVSALKARELVALGRYAFSGWTGRLSDRDNRVVARAMEAVGATKLADRDSRELSDGERQKLNLARVLAQEPRLIILDEPTAYLDVTARAELMALLREIARRDDISIIASTHDLATALRAADTIWLVTPDRRIHSGTPHDLNRSGEIASAFASERLALSDDMLGLAPPGSDAPPDKRDRPGSMLARRNLEQMEG
jgi:iron complex transport system ATP-binding protein